MTTALITGGTAGIGRAFAARFAGSGYGLVLAARDAARLDAAAEQLRALGAARVETIAADLSTTQGRALVEARLRAPSGAQGPGEEEPAPIDILVNNAGFGLGHGFLAGSADEEELLLDVLVRAPMRLTHAALPGMVERGRGAVINVSSVAAFAPRGTYSAAKAWVVTFSESVAAELRGTGVRCMALCPGFTHTEFHERAQIETGDIPGWMWLDADEVVQAALRDLRRGLRVSVPGTQYKVLTAATRYVPRAITTRVSRGMSKRW
ncbi:SDR family NAD(P)-dependent oxidoreductase [Actinocrinis puniceicyclus]|uniref:SDR family NAD(P)-dependent oxidoreductase n=1 Tax=Actinocrinis puniceicyclus TaxID=977794 RepID=A0A8J7WKI6_9ACTN|nr:SDR family NAD(P)-dependent oxidoreductase [Actinocrinis puniceicyclus]MBS2963986.1 SDR family NAD(P)-dependent oxidoreductase [Actinocrinis puniceicyclus]